MDAKFEGKCAYCGDRIEIGDPILAIENEWMHQLCGAAAYVASRGMTPTPLPHDRY